MQMLNEGIVPTAMLVATIRWRWAQCAPLPSPGCALVGYLSSGIRRYRRQLVLYPAVTTIKQDFRLLGQTSVDRLLNSLRARR